MKIELDTLLEKGIIDENKVTELYYDGQSIWKGKSDDLAEMAEDLNLQFIKFKSEKTGEFNEAYYKIEVAPILDENSRLKKARAATKILMSGDAKAEDKERASRKIKQIVDGKLAAINMKTVSKNGIGSYSAGRGLINAGKEVKSGQDSGDATLRQTQLANDPKIGKTISKEEPKKLTESLDPTATTLLNNLRKDIQGEYDAIIGYEERAEFAESNGYQDLADTLRDIRDEEKVHLGELNALLKKYDTTYEKSLSDGENEITKKD